MASFNKVIMIGNLTRDPELRYTPTSVPVANFGIAVNRVYKNKQGEKQEEVNFFNVVAWTRKAELCAEYLHKGSPVMVEGRLASRSWEDKEGGKRNTVEIVAENVQFLSSGRGAAPGPGSERKEAAVAPPTGDIDLDEDIPF